MIKTLLAAQRCSSLRVRRHQTVFPRPGGADESSRSRTVALRSSAGESPAIKRGSAAVPCPTAQFPRETFPVMYYFIPRRPVSPLELNRAELNVMHR